MSNYVKVLALAALLGAGAACTSGRYSPSGFSLPPDGNAQRGKQAFVELGCPSCHKVAGTELPTPAIQPAVIVDLGGEVDRKLSDGYLVTSMINPSHALAPLPKERITSGGASRMPSYADKMNVRQVVDAVAFLQSAYTVRKRAPSYAYRYLAVLPQGAVPDPSAALH